MQRHHFHPRAWVPSRIPALFRSASLYTDFTLADDPQACVLRGPASPFTVTRATAKTRVNSTRLIETVSAGQILADYDPAALARRGVRIEGGRTNTNFIGDSNWSAFGGVNATVTFGAVAPDGTTNAIVLAANGATSNHYLSSVYSPGVGVQSNSIYVKPGTGRYIQIATGGDASAYCNFDTVGLTYQLVGAGSASIEDAGGGWVRCVHNTGSTAASGLRYAIVTSLGAGRLEVHSGTQTFTLACPQTEAGSTYATSFIPAYGGSAVTRDADQLLISGAAFTSLGIGAVGTIYAEGVGMDAASVQNGIISLDDGTTANRMQLRRAPSFNGLTCIVSAGGVVQYNQATGSNIWNAGAVTKVALVYGAASVTQAFINGTGLAVGGAITIPTPTQMQIGNAVGGTYFNGWIRRVAYFPRALSSAEAAALTT